MQLALQHHFASLAGSDNPYILGYTVAAKPFAPTNFSPEFDPTDATFATSYNAANPSLSTLNFLLEANGMPVPGGSTQPNQRWVETTDADGRFCISKMRLFDSWLWMQLWNVAFEEITPGSYDDPAMIKKERSDHFEPKLNPTPEGGIPWSLTQTVTYKWTWDSGLDCAGIGVDGNFTQDEASNLTLSLSNPSADTARVGMDGYYYVKRNVSYQCIFDGSMWWSVRQAYKGAITFAGGTNGAVGMATIVTPDPVQSDHGGTGTYQLDENWGQNAENRQKSITLWGNAISSLLGHLQSVLDNLKSRASCSQPAMSFSSRTRSSTRPATCCWTSPTRTRKEACLDYHHSAPRRCAGRKGNPGHGRRGADEEPHRGHSGLRPAAHGRLPGCGGDAAVVHHRRRRCLLSDPARSRQPHGLGAGQPQRRDRGRPQGRVLRCLPGS